MMLFYQLEFCIAGDKESLVWEPPAALLFFFFHLQPIDVLPWKSWGWRQFWCHEDIKDGLGAHCGAPLGRHLLGSLVSQLIPFDDWISSLLMAFTMDDCDLGRLPECF